jgi:acetoacetyl-CoA synthetase
MTYGKEPISEPAELLSVLWQRVLGRGRIGINENFFDLGGDPWLAIKLFREIEKATGRLLSPLVIYQAPTIRSLVALLTSPIEPRIPVGVLLKPGDSRPPVFLMHGLSGNIMEFFKFVEHLQCSRPVYGLQARGTDGFEEPCASIQEMANCHADAIKRIQPHGPYLLVGYSLGGLVALEVARWFVTTGENIGLLVMIDSYPPLRYTPLAQQVRVYSRRAIRYTSRLQSRQGRSSLAIAFTPAMGRVERAAAKALRKYRPRYYPGRIRFVRAAIPLHFPDDPGKVWARFAGRLELETVPGDHHELLTVQYEPLGAVLSRYLCELPPETIIGNHLNEWSRDCR